MPITTRMRLARMSMIQTGTKLRMGYAPCRPLTSAFPCPPLWQVRCCFARLDLNGIPNVTPRVIRPALLHLALRRRSFLIAGSFPSAPRFRRVRLL